MEKILYINGCVRPESRTDRLARAVLDKLEGEITEVNLEEEKIRPLDNELLEKRNAFVDSGDFSDEMFSYAKMFKEADVIVMAAPYWDLMFPALIKIYMEAVTVTGLTFKYTEEGYPEGMCNATKFYYVTTAGGAIGDFDFGYDYIRIMAQGMFGIVEVKSFRAENLDIVGNDPEAILQEAIEGLEI